MTAEKFAMEHLGWYPETVGKAEKPISAAAWAKAATAAPPQDGVKVFAVKFSPDGATGCLSVAVRPDAGTGYVEVIRHFTLGDGITWLVHWLSERQDDVALIVIDGQGNAQNLHDRLMDEGGVPSSEILRPKTSDAIAAFSRIANDVKEGAVEHFGQDALNDSATQCTKRRIGTGGGWGFESTDTADACLIESAALAYWGAMTTTRDQRRELLLGW